MNPSSSVLSPMQFSNDEAYIVSFCENGYKQTHLECDTLQFWMDNMDEFTCVKTDNIELESQFGAILGAWTFFVHKHHKTHGSSIFDENTACHECLWKFFMVATSEFGAILQQMPSLPMETTDEDVFEWKQPDEQQHRFEPHETTTVDNDLKAAEVPQQQQSAPENRQRPQIEETEEHDACTLSASALAVPAQSSALRRNPPSVILTRINDDKLLDIDDNLEYFCELWTGWCEQAFDDCPPKFAIDNIDQISRKGSSALTISFYERPKKSLIRYFVNCVAKSATTCRAFVFKEDYTPPSLSPSPQPTTTKSMPQQHRQRTKLNLRMRSPPQAFSPLGNTACTPPQQQQRRSRSPLERRSEHFHETRRTPPCYTYTPNLCYNCGHHCPSSPTLTTPWTPSFNEHDRLARLEMKLNHVTDLIAKLLQ